ncbi:hypothetical protein [Kordiimonas laminariae]|uniref:hypothetical protein n=1 Tax=Kordiimonas laminariae TaxID=2917717 RepID=UPI001FF5E665|nr:hypothetical protein [Kordiimonas laminariae]MCK0068977.1 hypothetical protein [Kordiimonas laminariae]
MTLDFTVGIKRIAISLLAISAVSVSAFAAPASGALFAAAPKSIKRPVETVSPYSFGLERSQQETAIRFIQYAGIDKNLSLLLLNDVKTSAQVTDAINRIGFEAVKEKVVTAIKRAQLSNKAEWTEMLATVYLNYFEGTELSSILTERESSPFFAKMVELQTAISHDVDTQGKLIYKRARQQVLDLLTKEFAA